MRCAHHWQPGAWCARRTLRAGGVRKIRVAAKGQGKRSGARVIYYHLVSAAQIALLLIYPKNEQADLLADECKALKQIIETGR